MVKKDYWYVEKQLRKQSFGILSTISPKGWSHSSGVLYGVSPPSSKLSIYIASIEDYKKGRNVQDNPKVSFVVPFPHHYLRFVPSSTIYFQGHAEIVPVTHKEAIEAFKQKRILRDELKDIDRNPERYEGAIFIKITPNKKLLCYGLGASMLELAKDPHGAGYSVTVPEEKR